MLESVLQGGDSRLQSNAETRLTAKVPVGRRAAQVSGSLGGHQSSLPAPLVLVRYGAAQRGFSGIQA